MRILIAPNAFKNALDASRVAEAIKAGFKLSRLECDCRCFPIGDGGDGTGELLRKKYNATWIEAKVHDPLDRLIPSGFGYIAENKTAIIELADASGIRLVKRDELRPLNATTFGAGELLLKALDLQVRKIIFCVGGSATVDGGVGVLQALGVRFLTADGSELKEIPRDLLKLDEIDLSALDRRIHHCEIVVLTDVKNKLLGASGAAQTFGPQKGLTGGDIVLVENGIANLVRIVKSLTGVNIDKLDGGGAAGGVPALLAGLFNAKIVDGISYFMDSTGFEDALDADLVITAEGCLDGQTLEGKGPFGIAEAAKRKNIPVIALAGEIKDSNKMLTVFDACICIQQGTSSLQEALKNTEENLIKTAQSLGNTLAVAIKSAGGH